jgi:hypothetical protein
MAGSDGYCNEPSYSVKSEEFFDQLIDYLAFQEGIRLMQLADLTSCLAHITFW